MSFDALISKLTDPSLISIARHWRDARGPHAMPGWQDIDPTAIAPYLPTGWAWRFDAAQNTFVGRLAGDRIVSMLGIHSRGRRLEECFSPDIAPLITARYRKVLDGPSFMRGEGPICLRIGKQGFGERVVMPLAKDHAHADGILGATVYKLELSLNQTGAGEIDYGREHLNFFPLD